MTMLAPTSRTAVACPRSRSVVCHASCKPVVMQRAHMAAATIALTTGMVVAPAFAGVSFDVKSGATVSTPVHLEFAVDGMTVKPASEGLVENTGHFHVLIDEGAFPEGEAIPFDDTHKHYGKGQLTDDIALTPGKHTLTLQFANAKHESYGSKFASTIAVNVK